MSDDSLIPYNWWPRHYQLRLWRYLENGGKRAVALWHRRAGKDLLAINWIATKMMERVGLYWHTFPTYAQGKKTIWDGSTRDGRKFLDHFPAELISARNDTDMRITFNNGSVYQVVGVDDPDKLVGPNPIGIVFSEYSLQNPRAWNMMRPILNENDGWALFIYTMRGKNHGYKLLQMAKENPQWFAELLTIDDTKKELIGPDGKVLLGQDGLPILVPVITQAMVDEDIKMGMPVDLAMQEYWNSADAPIEGCYYAEQLRNAKKDGRIRDVPWEPNLPVDVSWDLGVDDETCLWFTQEYGANEIRVIDYYENSDTGLQHYCKVLQEKPYTYRKQYGPHDITVREWGNGGKSRIETARSLGIRFTVVPRHDVADGINAVRNILPRCWFDEKRCEKGLEALREYKKIYDPDRQVYRDQPFHDWASHPADAFRTFAYGRKEKRKEEGRRQEYAEGEYNMFTHAN